MGTQIGFIWLSLYSFCINLFNTLILILLLFHKTIIYLFYFPKNWHCDSEVTNIFVYWRNIGTLNLICSCSWLFLIIKMPLLILWISDNFFWIFNYLNFTSLYHKMGSELDVNLIYSSARYWMLRLVFFKFVEFFENFILTA